MNFIEKTKGMNKILYIKIMNNKILNGQGLLQQYYNLWL